MHIQLIRKRENWKYYAPHFEHYFRIEDCEGIKIELSIYGTDAQLIWKHMLMKEIESSREDMWNDRKFEELPNITLENKDTAVLHIASTPTP